MSGPKREGAWLGELEIDHLKMQPSRDAMRRPFTAEDGQIQKYGILGKTLSRAQRSVTDPLADPLAGTGSWQFKNTLILIRVIRRKPIGGV